MDYKGETLCERPQAQAYAHREPDETTITVYAGGTPIAVVSDGHAVEWINFGAISGAGTVQTEALHTAAFEFALAAAELSLRAMEAGVPDAYGRGS